MKLLYSSFLAIFFSKKQFFTLAIIHTLLLFFNILAAKEKNIYNERIELIGETTKNLSFLPSPSEPSAHFPSGVPEQFFSSKFRERIINEIEIEWDVKCVTRTAKIRPYILNHLDYTIKCSGPKVELTYRLTASYKESKIKGMYAFRFSGGKIYYRWK